MEGDYKIVEYDDWCFRCKHKEIDENEEPCEECLTIAARPDSRKPEKWEEA